MLNRSQEGSCQDGGVTAGAGREGGEKSTISIHSLVLDFYKGVVKQLHRRSSAAVTGSGLLC